MPKLNTIAIDLSKNLFQVCKVNQAKKVVENKPLKRSDITQYIQKQPISIIAMEACYSSHHWARLFLSFGHEVRLVPAQHVKPFVVGNKNDRNDAFAIYEASCRTNIRFVPVKSVERQDIQSLHRIRERIVSQRVRLMNQTRGLLSEYGIIISLGIKSFRSSVQDLVSLHNPNVSNIIRTQLRYILDELYSLDDRLEDINQTLKTICNENEKCQQLQSLPGVGFINATALYSAIGNASQFKSPRELAVWLGLTPRQYSSGDKSYNLGITKRGDRYLRKQLIHGARAVLYRCRKKTDKLSCWVNQLAQRRGVQKASVALASRLARLAWILLQRGECYKIQTV